jgi:hypothetical protein
MRWQEWRSDGTSGPRITGLFATLARSVEQAAAPTANLEEAVAMLDEGARRAGARLYGSPGTLARVAAVFDSPPGDEPANMGALVIINAMVFQERLASINPDVLPLEATRDRGHISKVVLIRAWDAILDDDYWPIFQMARDVASKLSDMESSDVLDECARTAERLLAMGIVGRHDLAGRIFNRLVSDRKFLAAFYTSIPAATLLAGLALLPDRWPQVDWTSVEELRKFRVIDPACGTGTLLMASHRQIVDNHRSASGDKASMTELHKVLMEEIICGADVVQAAIHVTAATLAAMSPAIKFSQMNLHTLKLGVDQSGAIWLGSLDWLVASQVQSFFSTTGEQVGAKSGITGALVPRPVVDLVISNPPYTRRGSDAGHEEAIAHIFAIPEGDVQTQSKIAKRTSELLRGTPANQIAGHGTSFAVLADRLVRPGGRIALVLPVTSLAGESWTEVRAMLSSRYQVEFVVSSHDPELRSMSYDTSIAEVLLVARRLKEAEAALKRGIFVNLWRAPRLITDALALLNGIDVTAQGALHRSDGPPVGGVPLMIGGDQWGEILDSPLDNGPWTGARWKRAVVAQYAAALRRGELWSKDGTYVLTRIKMTRLGDMLSVGPQDRQIRGNLGVFDAYHGWDRTEQFPAIWRHQESIHKFIRVGAEYLTDGEVIARRDPPGWYIVGMYPKGTDELAESIAEELRTAGYFVRTTIDVMPYKWGKLMENLSNAIGAITSGDRESTRTIYDAVFEEAKDIVQKAGIKWISQEQVARDWPEITAPLRGQLNTGGWSSTWQSLARHQGSVETEFLNGEIVRVAKRLGLQAPFNKKLMEISQEMAANHEPPGKYTPVQLRERLELNNSVRS